VAKDLMTYFITPEVMNANLKGGLGRWVPAIPDVVRNDSWWTDPKLDPFRSIYTDQTVLQPTIPNWIGYNPALGQVNAEQLWGQCHADVIKNGMKPADAVDKAFKRANEIFEKFSFG
jgi:multiple sugar transport system substrate-binding protein